MSLEKDFPFQLPMKTLNDVNSVEEILKEKAQSDILVSRYFHFLINIFKTFLADVEGQFYLPKGFTITASPSWFVQRQSSKTRWRSGSFEVTVTETAIVSPTATGRRKRSVCSR